ncbi:MAG: hypothetical protein M1821_005408 [Bathelium mastoideum]|nr:MAG: hypothetical protein M1821_005408 [Bathelium mastoideum]
MAPGLDVHVNGSMLTDTQRQTDFLQQILRLQDEVLAGKHPRIKLPSDVIAHYAQLQTAALQAQPSAIAGLQTRPSSSRTFDHANGSAPDLHPVPYLNGHADAVHSAPSLPLANGSFASGGKPASASGIDPIVMHNSEVNMQMDTQGQRQRLEQSLKEQYDAQKRATKGDGHSTVEALAPFDISDTLQQALQLVHHVSGLKPAADRSSSGSDAMHTNSYYSSQDNWSSQGSQASTKGPFTDRQHQVKQSVGQAATTSTQRYQSQTDPFPQGEALSNDAILPRDSFRAPPPPSAHLILPELGSPSRHEESGENEEGERDESEEYEPPAADELGAAAPMQEIRDRRLREHHRFSPPLPATSVVRNHIEVPLAPQPERVSPLATAKMPQVGQVQPNEVGQPPSPRLLHQAPTNSQLQHHPSQRGSPRTEQIQEDSSGSAQGKKRSPHHAAREGFGFKKRKQKNKRKMDRPEQPGRRTSGRREAESPEFEPYIKEEPVSPPMGSFAELPIAKRRQPVLLDDDVEMISPRRSDTFHVRDHPPSQTTYRHEVDQPDSPSTPQTASHPTYRRAVERDDQDLRRFASLQHARRPHSPPIRSTYEEPHVRAASQAYTERSLHRQESLRSFAPLQHVQRVLSPAPVYIDDDYPAPPLTRRVPASAAMPPPVARPDVVVDQYGNRYIAAPPEPAYESRRASAVPVASRRPEPERYERAVTRMPGRVVDPYGEEEVVRTSSRMAPPPPATRYIVDEAGHEFEAERLPNRDVEVQDSSRHYRQPVPLADLPRERERAYSVRPREDELIHMDRLRERPEMAPPASTPRRQSVIHNGPVPPQPPPPLQESYTHGRPSSQAQRSHSVRPQTLGDVEYRARPPPVLSTTAMRASVQPQVRLSDREFLVHESAPLGYRAVSVMHEGGRRGEAWAAVPPRMEPAQGRYPQYVGMEGDGGVQRVQGVRKEYVDDPMEGVEERYGGLPGRRVAYRY